MIRLSIFFKLILVLFLLITNLRSNSQTHYELWGTTNAGGVSNNGVLFKTDSFANNQQVKFNFNQTDGVTPSNSKLCLASNGKLYGAVPYGGTNNCGVLFEYNIATSTYTKLHDLVSTSGAQFCGELMQSSNGKLYGMATNGGYLNAGMVYYYDISTSTFFVVSGLDSSFSGWHPNAGLFEASNGRIYGMTTKGGPDNNGSIFQFESVSSPMFMIFYKFTTTDGGNSQSTFIEPEPGIMPGILYGMLKNGGSNGKGMIFSINVNKTNFIYKKYNFVDSSGSEPSGSLVKAFNGKLYGMTSKGGANNMGVIFEYNMPDSSYKKIYDFSTTSGGNPTGSLTLTLDGKLYGLTNKGGLFNKGTIFEYDITSSSFTKKFDFDSVNGKNPMGNLTVVCKSTIIKDTLRDTTVCANENVCYKINARGNGITYQWQGKNLAGWYDLPETSIFTGIYTNTLHVTKIPYIYNGMKFRCKVSSTCPDESVISDSGIVTVLALPTHPSVGQIVQPTCIVDTGEVTLNDLPPSGTWVITRYPGAITKSGTGSSTIFTGLHTGSYYFTVTDGITGCTSDSTNEVIIENQPPSPPTPIITQNGNTLSSNAFFGNQWYDQDGLIPGEVSYTFNPLQNGDYYVIVTLIGCSSQPSNTIHFIYAGISENDGAENIIINPNPTDGSITISGENIIKTEVLNISGKLLKTITNITSPLQIDLSSFSKGIYFIRVQTDKGTIEKKVLLQ